MSKRKSVGKKSDAISGELLTTETTEDIETTPVVGRAISDFLRAVDDFREACFTAIPALLKAHANRMERSSKKLEKFDGSDDGDGRMVYSSDDAHTASAIIEAIREYDRAHQSRTPYLVECSLFLGLFAEYDKYLGNLFSAIYKSKPDLFKNIRREMSLCDLLEFGDLESVKRDMLEKEIEALRRESYIEQFCILEKKFELSTLRNFPEWGEFVEIGQRRNLYAHNDGIVSQQYLTVCRREGGAVSNNVVIGQKLPLGAVYMLRAAEVLAKVGFMLGHTLWRKVLPGEAKPQSSVFNNQLYDLLTAKRWKAAAEYGQFGFSEPIRRGVSEIDLRIRAVNTAIALFNDGKKAEALDLLDRFDWTACVRDFRLAVLVLKESFADAAMVMRAIGKSGELVDQLAYHHWPLFNQFRGTDHFLAAYKEVYGRDFIQDIKQAAQKVESQNQGENSADEAGQSDIGPTVSAELSKEPKPKAKAKGNPARRASDRGQSGG